MRTIYWKLCAAVIIPIAFALANIDGRAEESAAPKPAQTLSTTSDEPLTKGREAIVLKSGETIEMGNLFWAVNCRSLLKGPPTVEVLEGPSEVTVSVRVQNVIPRKLNCAKEISGGMLLFTAAKEIKAKIEGRMTIRIKYPTIDGERENGREFNIVVFP